MLIHIKRSWDADTRIEKYCFEYTDMTEAERDKMANSGGFGKS